MKTRSEETLLKAIAGRRQAGNKVVAGIGDDCAVVRTRGARAWQLFKTDAVVEGIHYRSGTSPRSVGWKAMMRPLSDFAAMSGLPEFALVTLAINRGVNLEWMRELYRGLRRAAKKFRVEIVGGETTATTGPAMIAVSVAGYVEKTRCIFRKGGRAGDDLFVTGELGGSLKAHHLAFVPRIHEARWLTANFKPHAMMDLSDGLGADLPRMARASRVGFTIDEQALPLRRGCSIAQAISDGEDYELLFAISPRDRVRLEKAWRKKFPRRSLTRIGSFTEKSKIKNRKFPGGYDHFARRP